MDFEIYWQLIGGDVNFLNRKEAARTLWAQHPEKHDSIIAWLRKHGAYRGRNPYFFILDWQSKRQRQPEFLRGDEGGDLVQVRYNGAFKICTRQTAQQFNLQIIKNW